MREPGTESESNSLSSISAANFGQSRYETLTWVVRRKAAFEYLLANESVNSKSK